MESSTEVKIGDTVKCLNDHFKESSRNPYRLFEITLPEKGEVYRVRDVVTNKHGTGIRLEEIVNPTFYYGDIKCSVEPTFHVGRFMEFNK